jgi:hypothetical protein
MFHLAHILLTGPLAPPAYLDPGSGSFLIQMLIAAVLGIAVAVRASWGKIMKLFGKGQPDKLADDDADEEDAVK